jgi:hypothetical protein
MNLKPLAIRGFELSQKRINLYQVIVANGIASLIVFYFLSIKISLWPMIESVPSLQKLNNTGVTFTSRDYLINSDLEHSGRFPFLFASHVFSNLLNLTPEQYLSLGTALIIPFGPILVLITLIETRKRSTVGSERFTILDCLVLCLMQYFLAHYGPRLALAGYSSYRFPHGFTAETLSIVMVSISLLGLTNTKKNVFKVIFQSILFISILIHPAVGVTYLLLWAILKVCNMNFQQILMPFFPLILAAGFELYLSGRDSNVMSGNEFTQIWSKLRVPHHMIPTYFLSETFITYFVIGLMTVIFSRLILRLAHPFKHALTLASFVSMILLIQYVFVEKKSVFVFSQLSLTRGFVFIGFSFCAFFYWIYKDLFSKININTYPHLKKSGNRKRSLGLGLKVLIPISLIFGVLDIKSESESTFSSLRKQVETEQRLLGIKKGDLIFLDPVSVDSSGWREYGFVNIWLDSYFPFDLKSVEKYRERWLQLCGNKPMESCEFLTNRMSDRDFLAMMEQNEIDVIIRGIANLDLTTHGYVRTGVSTNYEAFRITNLKLN